MKKIFLTLFFSALMLPSVVCAASIGDELKAVITANDTVRAGNNIIFDASGSGILDNRSATSFSWNFGDGTSDRGENVVHNYSKPGLYNVTLTIKQGNETSATTRDIFVFKKRILLLTDKKEKKENIEALNADAKENGIYIDLIEAYESTTAFLSEESLTKKLSERSDTLSNADGIVSWTSSGAGINALSHLSSGGDPTLAAKTLESLKDKTIVVLTDKNLQSLARTLRVRFNIIHPKQLIVAREQELKTYLNSETSDDFLNQLQKTLSEYRVINDQTGRISIFNSISYLVNFMIVQGIPTNTIVLLLMLPVIATLIAFIKQVVGISTFGLYLPSIITLSFLALGLKFGLAILVMLVITGVILRKVLDFFPLLHIPRVAIILTISALIILLMLATGTYLGISSLANIAVFPMLIMTSLAEKFTSAVSERGVFGALILMLETAAVSLICYWVVEWEYLQTVILGYPEIILLLILVNYGLGRWTGLRLTEYLRFKSVMKHAEE